MVNWDFWTLAHFHFLINLVLLKSLGKNAESERLDPSIDFFAWFHIVCHRYASKKVYFTCFNTILPLSLSSPCRTQLLPSSYFLSYVLCAPVADILSARREILLTCVLNCKVMRSSVIEDRIVTELFENFYNDPMHLQLRWNILLSGKSRPNLQIYLKLLQSSTIFARENDGMRKKKEHRWRWIARAASR